MKYPSLLIFCLCLLCCQSATQDSAQDKQAAPSDPIHGQSVEAITLLGDTLFSPEQPNEQALAKYMAAKEEYEALADSPEALIWYGRRAGYLGKYQHAIEIFSEGIQKHPTDARMYRHRGHRYISTRQYDKAIADFEKAVTLIEGKEDQVEPDGIPNPQGIPISSLHGNIWYHLALAYYLKQNLEQANRSYQARYATHHNDDNIVSATHWYYMSLRRLGKEKEAAVLLDPISAEMDILENWRYHEMCLFYRGDLSLEHMTDPSNEQASSDVYLYGLGNWYLYEKQDTTKAVEYFERLLANGNKASFAYLAAESDIQMLLE